MTVNHESGEKEVGVGNPPTSQGPRGSNGSFLIFRKHCLIMAEGPRRNCSNRRRNSWPEAEWRQEWWGWNKKVRMEKKRGCHQDHRCLVEYHLWTIIAYDVMLCDCQ